VFRRPAAPLLTATRLDHESAGDHHGQG
jgi:hypothetical protein